MSKISGFHRAAGPWEPRRSRVGLDRRSGQVGRSLGHGQDDPRELAALQQLAALSAAAGDLVFRRADRLLRAAAGFDGHQIAIAGGRDEPENAVVFRRQLQEDYASAGAREKIDLLGLRQNRARLACGGNDDFAARDARHADDLGGVGDTRKPATGAGARLDERFHAEAQAVTVAGDGNRLDPRLGAFLLWRDFTSDSGIEAQRSDDPLAVFQLEEALNRLAVAG